jgi:hypothetical protein
MVGDEIRSVLKTKYGKTTQEINIIINDLMQSPLIDYNPQSNGTFFYLTRILQ